MKLFTTDDIHTIEQQTLSREAITTATLVERVGEGAASEIATRWRPSKRTIVFAGPGNNGADALATAIQLIDRGFNPSVYLFNIGGANIKPDCRRLQVRTPPARPVPSGLSRGRLPRDNQHIQHSRDKLD